ncbi:DUF6912 family protein [Arcanobacterium buesumense]|uniref:Uncharacterized protein n=1 Tax=Arcanobacterium buesumense TaxID=2722751 RepID=A0A6H2EID6_9ACTO|nr:hypothetical protein [Arcanobacterium buesumense]QJC21328.1 hypothetical protein HC352_01530 [Arcanobacterium buesumense]
MRIYIPLTLSDLRENSISMRRVHAVTPALRSEVPNEDDEGYEYIATLAAADDSLRLLQRMPGEKLSRVVAVAVVSDNALQPVTDPELPTEVDLNAEVLWHEVESFHVDAPGSEDLVKQAIAGDEDAFIATGDIELLWFDISEREHIGLGL